MCIFSVFCVHLCSHTWAWMSIHVCVCICMCVHASVFLMNMSRWYRQTPDGCRAKERDDGNLAQPLPEASGFAGDTTQV